MNTRSIRFRLVAWYAGVLTAVFVLLGGLMYAGLKFYLEQSLGQAQVRRAQQIADTLLANIGKTGEAHVASEINSWFAPETNDRFIRITRADGSVLYLSSSPKDLSFDASARAGLPGERAAKFPGARKHCPTASDCSSPRFPASRTTAGNFWSKSARRWNRSRRFCAG